MKRKQSLEEIYSEHMQDLFRYLLSLTGDSHSAEDLMQETFYRMLVHIDYYKGEEIRPWLFTIAYNAFIDWYRKEKKYKTTQIKEFHLPNVPSTEHSYFVKHEIASWLQSISSLPLERRNVLLLRDYYGFSYKEIAEMTGLSLAKVKIELHRGRKETKSIKE
ncbi:RNA polymerase sigma factor [Bacillus mycoides]|uniref:SigM family RNA polymerase sigma factor n=1 Tax=Bacillus cereus (strain VD146) TaxID=1053236 RepID=R8N7S0_BACCX|nr:MULTISPECIES: RNA polymerase sigma factor [Bacillus cereus group]EOP42590.1 SigM family RNA polymerase sigma factor [Bacillus cereus VD146]MDM5426564.1 RNA polymerase sigma factor [Bacillus mycoides]MED1057325.1 RNA polymerase sigma factor [Bacillus mycoides]QWH05306.1 RNA polymerase sigma factor [Bacillus mycoides]